jgi:PAS domain S-box-containing protein
MKPSEAAESILVAAAPQSTGAPPMPPGKPPARAAQSADAHAKLSRAGHPARENLRIIFLEDSALDAELVQRALRKHGLVFEAQRVDTKSALCAALEEFAPNLVLSDLTMPGFSGVEGLKITRERLPEVPFIYVSGTIGEDRAIELLRQGATDFVLKDNLARLVPAVNRALQEVEIRSEQRRAEEKIRSQARLLDLAHDAILVHGARDRRILFWNQGAERLYGWSAAEALTRDLSEWLVPEGNAPDRIAAELEEKGEWHGELQQLCKNGSRIVVSSRATLVRDEDGAAESVLVINTDITHQKKLEAQFLRAQRLESIGTLASGVAHDLNNILSPILMSAPLLRREIPAALRESVIATIDEAARRGTEIVKQVLTFARGIDGQRVLIDPRHLVRDMAQIARKTFPKTIAIDTRFEERIWPVSGDPTQLHQVLLNLAINARDALPNGGSLIFSCENFALDAHYASMLPGATAGSYVLLTVCDTGAGIPHEIVDRIFDPFFTTKEVGKGTGLGLSTVVGIAKSHGGFLNVYSEPGRGTTFKVFLPAAPGSEADAASPAEAEPPHGHGELILVVDDEASIRLVTESILREFGYEVVTGGDGIEGVALFTQHRSAIKAVLTDVVMPYFDGVALTRALKRIDPAVRIIATSGHADDGRVAALEELGVNAFLPKPYHTAKLLTVLHETLHATAR